METNSFTKCGHFTNRYFNGNIQVFIVHSKKYMEKGTLHDVHAHKIKGVYDIFTMYCIARQFLYTGQKCSFTKSNNIKMWRKIERDRKKREIRL